METYSQRLAGRLKSWGWVGFVFTVIGFICLGKLVSDLSFRVNLMTGIMVGGLVGLPWGFLFKTLFDGFADIILNTEKAAVSAARTANYLELLQYDGILLRQPENEDDNPE